MTTPPDELIKYFSDGMLPTGENFAALITSMVHRDDFQRQVHRFEDWISQPELSLGADAGSWRIYADPENKLRIAPGNPGPRGPQRNRHSSGWVDRHAGTGGRVDRA